MKNETKKIIEEMRKSLRESGIPLKGIYLFGSRAKDSQSENSDYDIAVILKTPVSGEIKDAVRSLAYDIMLKYDVVIDSHVYYESDIEMPATPFREAIRAGGIFYGI